MKRKRQDHPLFTLARSGRRLTHAALAVILTVTFFAVGLVAVSSLGRGSAPAEPSALQGAIGLVMGLLVAFLPPVLLLWGWLHFFEKRSFWTVGLAAERPLLKFARGFLVGFSMFALVTALLGVFGLITFEDSARDLGTLGSILIVLVAWTLQGSSEEIVVRGWLLPVVGVRYGRLAAVAVSSGLFAVCPRSTSPSSGCSWGFTFSGKKAFGACAGYTSPGTGLRRTSSASRSAGRRMREVSFLTFRRRVPVC